MNAKPDIWVYRTFDIAHVGKIDSRTQIEGGRLSTSLKISL